MTSDENAVTAAQNSQKTTLDKDQATITADARR